MGRGKTQCLWTSERKKTPIKKLSPLSEEFLFSPVKSEFCYFLECELDDTTSKSGEATRKNSSLSSIEGWTPPQLVLRIRNEQSSCFWRSVNTQYSAVCFKLFRWECYQTKCHAKRAKRRKRCAITDIQQLAMFCEQRQCSLPIFSLFDLWHFLQQIFLSGATFSQMHWLSYECLSQERLWNLRHSSTSRILLVISTRVIKNTSKTSIIRIWINLCPRGDYQK